MSLGPHSECEQGESEQGETLRTISYHYVWMLKTRLSFKSKLVVNLPRPLKDSQGRDQTKLKH